jgi:hypothetical protein
MRSWARYSSVFFSIPIWYSPSSWRHRFRCPLPFSERSCWVLKWYVR